MMDKTNTEGMKLYVGGEEVTQDFVERAIAEYEQKIQSPQFQKELKELEDFLGKGVEKKTNSSCKYYRLPVPPHTIFKLNIVDFITYKFDEMQKCWIEFPTFLVDLEYGNIKVEEIEFEDRFSTVSALDLSNGRQR